VFDEDDVLSAMCVCNVCLRECERCVCVRERLELKALNDYRRQLSYSFFCSRCCITCSDILLLRCGAIELWPERLLIGGKESNISPASLGQHASKPKLSSEKNINLSFQKKGLTFSSSK